MQGYSQKNLKEHMLIDFIGVFQVAFRLSRHTDTVSDVMGKAMTVFKRLYILAALVSAIFLAVSLF